MKRCVLINKSEALISINGVSFVNWILHFFKIERIRVHFFTSQWHSLALHFNCGCSICIHYILFLL